MSNKQHVILLNSLLATSDRVSFSKLVREMHNDRVKSKIARGLSRFSAIYAIHGHGQCMIWAEEVINEILKMVGENSSVTTLDVLSPIAELATWYLHGCQKRPPEEKYKFDLSEGAHLLFTTERRIVVNYCRQR